MGNGAGRAAGEKTEECGWNGGKKWEIAQQFLIFQRAKRSEPRKEGRRGNREYKVRKGDGGLELLAELSLSKRT